MPSVVLPLIAAGALTQLLPADFRGSFGAWLDARGAAVQVIVGFAMLYVVIALAPSASAPFIYFQF